MDWLKRRLTELAALGAAFGIGNTGGETVGQRTGYDDPNGQVERAFQHGYPPQTVFLSPPLTASFGSPVPGPYSAPNIGVTTPVPAGYVSPIVERGGATFPGSPSYPISGGISPLVASAPAPSAVFPVTGGGSYSGPGP